jgi:hypothetical protein
MRYKLKVFLVYLLFHPISWLLLWGSIWIALTINYKF